MNNSQNFPGWSSPRRLSELSEFYEAVKANPTSVDDAEFIRKITGTFWPTNCSAFVEQSFAIIAPGCSMRPHLVRQLIAHPIEAMIAGGLLDENDVIAQGLAYANNVQPYVEPTPDGRRWLLEQWPRLEDVAVEVYRQKYHESLN
ncbi:hypothetical protein [Duganella sp. S19_KUP01_CR8]|uniref:hypothetical protein n=1 Tax=Duganella sp. S19_KUP01_CR8 TaxID=3025502 RepID=UPI002FCD854A